jgi:phosphate transport system substrate-binding protein
MFMKRLALLAAGILAATAAGDSALARDQASVVASSSSIAYFEAAAERMVQAGFPAPKVVDVSTGDRRLKIFCGGVGVQYPDLAGMSRKLKDSQIEACKANGVADLQQIKFGYDGVALVRKASHVAAQPMNLTARHLWLAMAAQVPVNGALAPNPHKLWSEVDPALPAIAIHFYMGPNGNNPRQMATDYAAKACMDDETIKALTESEREPACTTLRADHAVTEFARSRETVEALVEGEEDVIAVSAYGLFQRFGDDVAAATLDGIAPNTATIVDGSYPLARAQYMVVKTASMSEVPGLRELVLEMLSDEAHAPDGYLQQLGLIPLPPEERTNILQSFGS